MSISGGVHLVSSNHLQGIPVKKTTLPRCLSRDLLLKSKCPLYFQPLPRVRLSLTCKAGTLNNDKGNPDSPKNNFQGPPPRGKFKNDQGREDLLEMSQMLSSKNGRSTSSPSTATISANKKDILELFRKHLPKLRDNRPVNNNLMYGPQATYQKRGKEEREAFDSLLKLLKTYPHGPSNNNDTKGTINNIGKPGEYEEPDVEDDGSENINGGSDFEDDVPEVMDSELVPVTGSRPVSSFSRRSPVPMVELEHEQIVPSKTHGGKTEMLRQEEKSGSVSLVYESESESKAEQSESPQPEEEKVNLGALKLSELREIAKSRGMKGYSKLKKAELVEQLSTS